MGDVSVGGSESEDGNNEFSRNSDRFLVDDDRDEIYSEIRQDSYAELDYDEENHEDFIGHSTGKIAESEENYVGDNLEPDLLEDDLNNESGSQKSNKESAEDGEIDDLEEGELKSDGESEKSLPKYIIAKQENYKISPVRRRSTESEQVGICKFFLLGKCTWGPDCKYVHPSDQDVRGGYSQRDSPREAAWSHSESTREKSNMHSRVVYPFDSADLHKNEKESAWERGLRQARELMLKASKKREEEPDFDRKRLVLTPGDEFYRGPTDDDSDDSQHNSSIKRNRLSYSPKDRLAAPRDSQKSVDLSRAHMKSPHLRDSPPARRREWTPPRRNDDNRRQRADYPMEDLDSFGETIRYRDTGNHTSRQNTLRAQRIPSLIDGLREGRFIPPPRNVDLGPQVLYPNGRPNNTYRRTDRSVRKRYTSPADRDRYYVPHAQSRSPRSRRSPSISPQRSPLFSTEIRKPVHIHEENPSLRSPIMKKRKSFNNKIGGILTSGDAVRDPWDRNRAKRGRSNDPTSVTLGAVLKKARRKDVQLGKKTESCSSRSSISRNASPPVSSRTTSRSRSVSSEETRRARIAHRGIRQAPPLPLGNPFDDDGSLLPTDLSSFKIPKKKRTTSPVCEGRESDRHKLYKRQSARQSQSVEKKKMFTQKCIKQKEMKKQKEDQLEMSDVQAISSDNSSDSESSSSDGAEPAAYRRKRKSIFDDGDFPTEGIPLSPEPEYEPAATAAPPMDVSSDENDYFPEQNPDHSTMRTSFEAVNAFPSQKTFAIKKPSKKKSGDYEETSLDRDELVECDDRVDKEENRAELLRRLKCVEEAIARKRGRPTD